jgi:hypothetical protein
VIADRGQVVEQDWKEGLELERSDSLIRDSYIEKLAGRQLTDRQRGELKAQAVRLLLKGRREYRGDAARALAIIGTEKDYDTLMEAFNDDGIENSAGIRNEIISSIGRLHIQEAVPDLLERYRAAKERFKENYAKKAQADDMDRRAALTQKDVIATALGRIGDIAAVSELITDMKNIYMNDDGKGIGIAEDGYEAYFYQFRPPFFAILEIYDRNKHDAGKVETIVDQLIGTLLKAGEEPGLDTKWSAEALLKIINIEQQDTKITGALAKFRAAHSAVDDDMEQAVRKLIDARKKSLIAERSAKEAAAPAVTVNRTKKGQELYLDFHYVESQGLLMKAANEFGAEMIDDTGYIRQKLLILRGFTIQHA